MIDEQARAWHAGNSSWRGLTDVNSASIGVELDNDGQAPYPAVQIDALLRLLEDLRVRHRLPATAFAGHSDIAPGRKLDPGPAFPWQILAKQGFGIWCDFPKESPPVGFDPIFGLAAIGYNVREPQAAINAFRVRFKRDTRSKFLNKSDLAMIYCLAKESILR